MKDISLDGALPRVFSNFLEKIPLPWYSLRMDRAETIVRLRAHEAELKRLGLQHVSLFGSTARGDARDNSDIDLLVDLDPDADLFDYAGIIGALEGLLSHPVDVAQRDRLKPHVAPQALRDEIHVF